MVENLGPPGASGDSTPPVPVPPDLPPPSGRLSRAWRSLSDSTVGRGAAAFKNYLKDNWPSLLAKGVFGATILFAGAGLTALIVFPIVLISALAVAGTISGGMATGMILLGAGGPIVVTLASAAVLAAIVKGYEDEDEEGVLPQPNSPPGTEPGTEPGPPPPTSLHQKLGGADPNGLLV